MGASGITAGVVRCGLVAALLLAASPAGAAGFALEETSAAGLGTAFASGGAAAEEPSTVFNNPASITRLQGELAQAVAHVIAPTVEFHDRGSVVPATGAALLPGASRSDDGGRVGIVPNFYYVRDLAPDLKLGLSVSSPFGLSTRYPHTWIGRYNAVESKVQTVNMNPALALRRGPLSIGVGVSAEYFDAKLTRAIDFDAICIATGAGCAGGAPGSGTTEGFAETRAHGVGFGFDAGVLFAPSERTRLSVAYRSRVAEALDGHVGFSGVPAVLAGAFAADGMSAEIALPASLSLGAYQRVGERFAVLADATWTGWSSFQNLVIHYDRPTTAGGPTIEPFRYGDTWRLALGVEYYRDSHWTLRAGTAWDESPVPDSTARTVSVPDSNRTWIAVGASYRTSEHLAFDVGYAHLFLAGAAITRTNATGSELVGIFDSQANILSAQVRYRF